MLLVGQLIPVFWTFHDVFSGFQSQSGQPYSHLVEAHVIQPLRFSCLWPAWQLSQSFPCTCNQALVGLEQETYHASGKHSTD